MDRQTFFSLLKTRLYELGVSEDYVNKYIRQFERYFNTMTDEEAQEQINGFDGVDGIARNIVGMIKKREQKEQSERELENAEGNDAPTMTYNAVRTQDTVIVKSGDTRVMDAVRPAPAAQPVYRDTGIGNEANNMRPAEFGSDDDIRVAEETYYSSEEDDLTDDTQTEYDDEAYEATREYNTVESDITEEEADNADDYQDEEADYDEGLYEDGHSDESAKTREHVIMASDDVGFTDDQSVKKPRPRETRVQRQIEPIVYDDEYEEAPLINFNELDDEEQYEESIPNTVLYWAIVILTIPITLPLILALLIIFGAVFGVMAVMILGLVIGLIGVIIAGTGVSLVGIIYGVTQVFENVPIGLFEIGIGVAVGGAAMLVGILAYNFAIRLLPFAMRYWGIFFGFTLRKIKELFRLIKRECAKQR